MDNVKNNKIWEPIDFTVYLNFIKWPVLLAVAVEILIRWIALSFPAGFLFDQMEILSWIIRLVALGYISYKSVQNFGYSTAISAISGIMSGFVIGFIVSVFRFLDGIALWKFFNIITETTIVAIVGSLVALFVNYTSNIKK